LVAIFSDQIGRITGNAAPQLFPHLCGTLPKPVVSWAQRFFQDDSVLRFGAAPVLGGSTLEGVYEVRRQLADK
jgi:hypothetical protein